MSSLSNASIGKDEVPLLEAFLCVTLKSVSAGIGGLQYTRNVCIVASGT